MHHHKGVSSGGDMMKHVLLSLTIIITLSQAFLMPIHRLSTSHRSITRKVEQQSILSGHGHHHQRKMPPLLMSSSSSDPDKDGVNSRFNELLNDGNGLLELIDYIKRHQNQIEVDWQKVCHHPSIHTSLPFAFFNHLVPLLSLSGCSAAGPDVR